MSARTRAAVRLFALPLLALVAVPQAAHAILWRSSYVPRGEGGATGNTSSLRSGDVVDVVVVICGVVLALVVLFFVVRMVMGVTAAGGGRRRKRPRGGRVRGGVSYDADRRPRDLR